jgi:hypothetical protein
MDTTNRKEQFLMAKKDHFLQQLQRRKMHLKQAPSHVDGPSEKTMEQLERGEG